jgi:hypothetical protein
MVLVAGQYPIIKNFSLKIDFKTLNSIKN